MDDNSAVRGIIKGSVKILNHNFLFKVRFRRFSARGDVWWPIAIIKNNTLISFSNLFLHFCFQNHSTKTKFKMIFTYENDFKVVFK